jgi:formamidopyrimidine-DNA glycosylase
LDDGTELRYQDTRKFGRMQLADRDNYRKELPLSKLGPEPWSADPEEIYQKLHRSRLPVKSLLLDQRILTGIGNIYANEICFELRIDPRTPGNQLEPAQAVRLVEAAKAILNKAIDLGGTTIHSFSAGGITGRFQNELQVHMQTVCPVCKGPIMKEAVNGRGTYYCAKCQV